MDQVVDVEFEPQGLEMLPLPLKLKLRIIRKLHYTCYPAILHVNRSMRKFILDNCAAILKDRDLFRSKKIPYYFRERVTEKLIEDVESSPAAWPMDDFDESEMNYYAPSNNQEPGTSHRQDQPYHLLMLKDDILM
jgi:hypothetical protein